MLVHLRQYMKYHFELTSPIETPYFIGCICYDHALDNLNFLLVISFRRLITVV